MKKILFIVPSLGMGGMERVLVNYANLLVKKEYDVSVINFTFHDDAIVSNLLPEVHYSHSYVPVPHILHASFKNIIKFNFRFLPWQKWINFHSAKYLHKKYIKEHFDVEIGFGGINTYKVVSGNSDLTTQKIGWIHGIHIEKDIATVGDFKATQRIYNKLDKFICVSELSKDSLLKNYGRAESVYVLSNPNDTVSIRNKAQADIAYVKKVFTFISVARFSDEQKGQYRLMNVCKKLNDENLKYEMWLIGDGPDFEFIKNRAKELNLNNVKFWGKQDNPYKYMSKADVYLCTSYTEGFSMVMMEAIILAKPMVTTDVSGAAEMLNSGEYGIIVENSEQGIYEGMKKMITDPDAFKYYARKAEERKDYLSEKVIIEKFEDIVWGTK